MLLLLSFLFYVRNTIRAPFLLETSFLCVSDFAFARDIPIFVYGFSLVNEDPQ
jgi:hypothetical protein